MFLVLERSAAALAYSLQFSAYGCIMLPRGLELEACRFLFMPAYPSTTNKLNN
jgi:hypothetical protein